MKVLFLESNPVWTNGLPNGFRDTGHDVLVSGPLTENNIPKMISEFRPDLIITMAWSPETEGKKADWIRENVKAAGIPHVYWATEDPTHTDSYTLPLVRRMRPDFVFSICPQRVNEYRGYGIKAAHLDFGFHPSVHYNTIPQEKYKCSVALVANAYPDAMKIYPGHYRIQSIKTLISPLIMRNIRVDFWGAGWEKLDFIIGRKIPQQWIRGFMPYTLANQVYSSADIIIGLQNHRTQITQRTYEILASKGFLITSDTPEIRRLFVPGKDLIVSSSPEQTLSLIRYYLREKVERDKICGQGQRSAAPHNYMNRARYMIGVLINEKILK